MKRRHFLYQTALAGLATAVAPSCAAGKHAKKSYPIGLQLYTVRDEMKAGLDKVLAKLASLGYQSIEMYGYNNGNYFGNSIAETKAILQRHNLQSPSAHVYNPGFLFEGKDDIWKKAVADAAVLGQEYLVVPWLQPDKRSRDDYKRLAKRLNDAATMCKAGGLKFAYHNHDFEFADLGGGEMGYDIITKETDAALVKLEADMFWVVFAGKDPASLMEQHKGRIKLWHVKDMNPANRTNIEIGAGSIDYKSLLAKAKSWKLDYYFIEQENYTISPFDSVEKSIAYVKTLKT